MDLERQKAERYLAGAEMGGCQRIQNSTGQTCTRQLLNNIVIMLKNSTFFKMAKHGAGERELQLDLEINIGKMLA